jgi:hypothetical protein
MAPTDVKSVPMILVRVFPITQTQTWALVIVSMRSFMGLKTVAWRAALLTVARQMTFLFALPIMKRTMHARALVIPVTIKASVTAKVTM